MPFEDLIVLIPSHSLEDFPTDLGESEAESLLNAFAVAWHPALIAAARVTPHWHRADDPPDVGPRRLIFVPTGCEELVPAGWTERATAAGCTVVRGISKRAAMVEAALAGLGSTPTVDPDWTADFFALGTCFLQIELLTRKMRHFSSLDEVHLQREAVAAAEAALAGDGETVHARLANCFEALHEARERFYPVECYLIDLCLVIPRLADDNFRHTLAEQKPVSILASAADLWQIVSRAPDVQALWKAACERGSADLVCGDLCELPLPLMPLESIVWQLQRAQELAVAALGKRASVWGRRRYGLLPQLPQILCKAGFSAALHVVLDDGIYPDVECSKLRWEGVDGTSLDALSRIPLAADAAATFLRLPERIAESMDNDHVAGVVFARWPEIKCPIFEDLCRVHRYAPVLGKFVTLGDFFANTDDATRHLAPRPGEYLTPYLFQSAARREADAIARYAGRFERRAQLDVGLFLSGICHLLTGRTTAGADEIERDIEELPEIPAAEQAAAAKGRLDEFVSQSAGRLTELVMHGAGDGRGWLIFNTLGFARKTTVVLDPQIGIPQPAGEPDRVQHDATRTCLTVDLPGAGFVWVPAGETFASMEAAADEPPMAEPYLLRNEFFEVSLNESTGGIARIKGYGRSPARLSQQLNYRFSRERTVVIHEGDEQHETRTHYAEMRATAAEVTSAGPALGEIVTTGEIVDQTDGTRLAGFRQATRVWRGRRAVEIEIELTPERLPDAEPWHNYYAARFAWNDETASLTRSVTLGAFEAGEERLESPHYLEIATAEQRTTIVAPGLPFHRKTGPRMLDTLLIVPGETRRTFRIVIAVDEDYPLQAALGALTPPVVVPTRHGPPRAGTTGWFFHLDARNVQLLQLLPLAAQPSEHAADAAPVSGCAVRLVETEGRSARVRLRCIRNPTSARVRDYVGSTLARLVVEGDAVALDLSPYEIADVEVRFD